MALLVRMALPRMALPGRNPLHVCVTANDTQSVVLQESRSGRVTEGGPRRRELRLCRLQGGSRGGRRVGVPAERTRRRKKKRGGML